MAEKFNYTEFFEEVENDLTIHSHDIDKKIFSGPNVHNKILRRFTIERNTLQKLETKLNKIFAEKYHHYRYNYEIKIESKEVTIFYINKDEEYLKVNDEYNRQKLLVDTIERWMKKANSIGYDIKNIVEYLKWSSGK